MSEQNTDVKSLAHTKWNCKYHVVFAPETKPEKMYLRIPANVQNAEKRERQKRSIHERLEEKKRQGQNADYVRQRKIHNRDCL